MTSPAPLPTAPMPEYVRQDLRTLFPTADGYKEGDWGWAPGISYNDLLRSLGLEIAYCRTTGYWQGDYTYLLRYPGSGLWGMLVQGYGSCSGCDALEACRSYSMLEALRDNMVHEIRWFTTPERLVAFLEGVSRRHAAVTSEQEAEALIMPWWYYDEDLATFAAAARAYFTQEGLLSA